MSNTTNKKIYFSLFLKYWYVLVCIGIICNILLPTVRADVSTNVFVPPQSSYYQFNFSSGNSGGTFPIGTLLTYTITYGAQKTANIPANITLVADFSQDSFHGAHILDYVVGSATNGYNNTIPVVSLTQRTITWKIPQLPAGTTDQKVTFQVLINSNYTETQPLNFSVKAIMSSDYFTFPEQVVYQTLNTQITPTPGPTSPITPTPLPTITPTPPQAVTVTDVFFNTISDKTSEISVGTSLPAKISVFYGTSPTSLTTSFATSDFSSLTKTLLTNLNPNTVYYVQVKATDAKGNKSTSELFTFKTASAPPTVDVTKSIVVLTSNGNLLNSGNQNSSQNANPTITLPNTVPYQVTYTIPPSLNITSLSALVRNKHILGVNTYEFAPRDNLIEISMLERQPDVYFAQLPPIINAGDYEVFVRVAEKNGNIYEQSISEINVSLPLQVVEKTTNQPLEGARLYFYFYNNATKQYQPINEEYINIKNPDFSDRNGYVSTVLPKGRYRVKVSAVLHNLVQKDFTIDAGSKYPTIYLEKQPYNILTFLRYCMDTVSDFISNLNDYVYVLSISVRYFNVLASLIVLLSIFLSFLLFSMRAYIPLTTLPTILYHHLHYTFLPDANAIVFGKVVDQSNKAISQADVYFLDEDKKVLSHTTTNGQGGFSYKKQPEAALVEVMQEGYDRISVKLSTEKNIIVTLPIHHHISKTVRKQLLYIVERIAGFFLEAIMAVSICLELAFLVHFGFWRSLPFFLLSLINIILWLLYTKETVRNFLKK